MKVILGVCMFISLATTVSPVDFSYKFLEYDAGSSIHTLEVNPNVYEISSVRAKNVSVEYKETVLSIAKRVGALAAINGGFWKKDRTPAGILKSFGKMYGGNTKLRGAIGWKKGINKPFFDRLVTQISPEGDLQFIPFKYRLHKRMWHDFDHIVGRAPILVENGRVISNHSLEKIAKKFEFFKHARTAVGVKPNGNWVFVVVDSKEPKLSGLTILELGKYMRTISCIHALNLDGGSSSTLFLEDAVINYPHGDYPEEGKNVCQVSDAIVICAKKKN